MHHVDMEAAPEALSEDDVNVSKTIYVYDTKEAADLLGASQIKRRLTFGLLPDVVWSRASYITSTKPCMDGGRTIQTTDASCEPDVLEP